ncbi:hypothetical protein H5410_027156 [Solanum commersonii]|uniref:Uncharacterized protein n=1 Tax=Solanum commersonii TaxID=4109 RepID=A0A9J5Z100_SOLCO|nr:hypothetical protein H5410_027156 [Solanum commersonii]
MIQYSHTELNQFNIRNPMQCSRSKRGTQCMFSPIGFPLFSNRLSIRLLKIKKVFLSLVMGMSAKVVVQVRSRVHQGSSKERLIGKILGLFMQVSNQVNHTTHRHLSQTRLHTFASVQRSLQKNQFDKWLITMRCKEFTYCVCNFIWPHRSHTFMFVQLRALFKSSVLIKIES